MSKLLLKEWYSMNSSPDDKSKLSIAKKAGISVTELNRWLRNKKRRAGCLNQNRYEYTIVLERYFLHKAQYLEKGSPEMQDLINETKLSSAQIQKWFANKRRTENISVIRYGKGNRTKHIKKIKKSSD